MEYFFSKKQARILGFISLALLVFYIYMPWEHIAFPYIGLLCGGMVIGFSAYTTEPFSKRVLSVVLCTIASIVTDNIIAEMSHDKIGVKYEGTTKNGTVVIINENTCRAIITPKNQIIGKIIKADSLTYDGYDSSGNLIKSVVTAFKGGKPIVSVFPNMNKAYVEAQK
jgi:hypothetical protein